VGLPVVISVDFGYVSNVVGNAVIVLAGLRSVGGILLSMRTERAVRDEVGKLVV
jgi:hypothetical protein